MSGIGLECTLGIHVRVSCIRVTSRVTVRRWVRVSSVKLEHGVRVRRWVRVSSVRVRRQVMSSHIRVRIGVMFFVGPIWVKLFKRTSGSKMDTSVLAPKQQNGFTINFAINGWD